jgi:hypothetical protein
MVARADTSEKLRQAMLQLGSTRYMELDKRKFLGRSNATQNTLNNNNCSVSGDLILCHLQMMTYMNQTLASR